MNNENEEKSFDLEATKQYIERLFSIEREIMVLREDKKELAEEFKGKVDKKLVAGVIRFLKAEAKLKASSETIDEVSELVRSKLDAMDLK